MDNRLEFNLEILKRLERFFIDNPDVRFIQGLWALGIIEKNLDKFHEESRFTLEKLKKRP